jgi:transcriptional regulator with XRE-family HTH domain
MKFGDFLRSKREQAGWTQPEAASRAGIEQSYLSKLETGRSFPSEDIYGRLSALYELDTDEMIGAVDSADLERMREVRAVRAAILEHSRSRLKASRGWLVAGSLSLVLAGAFLGTALVAHDLSHLEYTYRSDGVLAEDEPLDAFDAVKWPEDPLYEAPNQRRAEMTARLDPVDVVTDTLKGEYYIESVDGGRRVYEYTGSREIPSPLRWLMVPAVIFIFASAAFFILRVTWGGVTRPGP